MPHVAGTKVCPRVQSWHVTGEKLSLLQVPKICPLVYAERYNSDHESIKTFHAKDCGLENFFFSISILALFKPILGSVMSPGYLGHVSSLP